MIIGDHGQRQNVAPFSRLKPDSAQQMGSEVYISGEDDAITETKVRINDQSTISFA